MSKTKYHWTGHTHYYDMDVNSEDVTHHKFNWAVIPALLAGLLLAALATRKYYGSERRRH